MKRIPKANDRAEWLAQRHAYFNASDAAALLDRHPFRTLQQIVRAKLQPEPVNEPENEAMRRGRHAEPFVADWLADRDGLDLYEPPTLYVNGSIMATLDRLPAVEDGTAVEIKTTAKRITEPERYWLDQVQLQMHAAGLDAVVIAAVDGTWKLQTWRIERDDALIAGMVDRAETIMAAVRKGEWPTGVPEADPETTRQPGTTIELDADGLSLVDDLATVRQQLRDLEAEENVTRLALLRALADADVGEHDGRPLIRRSWTSRRHIDTTRLRADHPELIAGYETSKSWPTLRVVTP